MFLLWVSDERALNRVLVNDGQVVRFFDEKSAREYAQGIGLPLAPEEDLHLHDIDSAAHWLDTSEAPNCGVLLAIWNLAGDVAGSVNEPFEVNLPSVTPPAQRYEPEWTEEQLALLHSMIRASVDLIRSRLVPETS